MDKEVHNSNQMKNFLPFGEILEAADHLPIDDQLFLRDILTKRIIERRRNEIAQDICESRREYAAGQCKPVSLDELMSELLA